MSISYLRKKILFIHATCIFFSSNRAAETAKLAALQAEQKRLDAAIAACRASYPE